MAVVAAVGLTLGVAIQVSRLTRLGRIYRSRAQAHADLARGALVRAAAENQNLAFWRKLAAERRKKAEAREPRPDSDESWEEAAARTRDQAAWFANEVDTFTKRAVYHEAMRRKWLHASAYPWLRVEPDSQIP
jgi:hypothetical protein